MNIQIWDSPSNLNKLYKIQAKIINMSSMEQMKNKWKVWIFTYIVMKGLNKVIGVT